VERFYEALNRLFTGDPTPMGEVWAETPDVVLMGPFGGRKIGRPEVYGAFKRDADLLKGGGLVTPRNPLIRVGKELAYGVTIERGEVIVGGKKVPVDLRATLILQRLGDKWLHVYHHTDPLPELQKTPGYKVTEFTPPRGEVGDPGVLKALDRYYEASNATFSGDFKAIEGSWLKGDDVTMLCPTGNIKVGWKAIRDEFGGPGPEVRGKLRYEQPLVRVFGDLAYVSHLTTAPDMTIGGKPYPLSVRSTIIFRREGGSWLVAHAHGDLDPGLIELCGG
jgi:ketosteroid isomerase-like protein